jgi:serpin B
MIVLLPRERYGLAAVEERLSAESVRDWTERLHRRQTRVELPRFELESSFGLGSTLASMGMPQAFTDQADFSGMTGERDLFISKVIHKAFVEVNEEGTEAAAATGVVMELASAPAEPIRVDHPFVFLILDRRTDSVLFLGRVVDPTA